MNDHSNQEGDNDGMDVSDIQMTNEKDDAKSERSVVLLGSRQKEVFFKQLCDASAHYERHVHYQDVHYLTIEHAGTEQVIEVTDPGLARTGGREMALRCADFIILYYSSMSIDSLQVLQPLIQTLQMQKNMPILIICDADEVVLEDSGSAHTNSTSEGYESDERDGMKRHYSMEQIRRGFDDNSIAVDGGEKLAGELGSRCYYMKISSSNIKDAQKVLNHMIETINKTAPPKHRRKSVIKDILRSKSTDRAADSIEVEKKKNKKNKKDGVDESKVCIVM